MKSVVIASQNPVKIQAARLGFEQMFPYDSFEFVAINTPSGVNSQPLSDSETLQGAANRLEKAMIKIPSAHYWVGIEGGIEKTGNEMAAFAWVVVRTQNQIGKAKTGTFFLPQKVAALIREGKELGEADDIVFGRSNSKQENGAIGILTDNVVDRTHLYLQAVILALVPFKNPSLYDPDLPGV